MAGKVAEMKKLLVRADDFGASPGTNRAIVEAVKSGFVRNVGVMAPVRWLEHCLHELLELREEVCLGLHATLNSEWAELRWGPVSEMTSAPGLVRPDGTFHESVEKTHRFSDPQEGVREIRAQLEKLRGVGLAPQYLDCHMGFNWHPDWDRAIGEFAIEEGLVYHASGMLPGVGLNIFKPPYPGPKDVIHLMESDGIDTVVWVFHPACRDEVSDQFYHDAAKPSHQIAVARDQEYRFLTDSGSAQAFHECKDVQLIRYIDLQDQPVTGKNIAFQANDPV